MTAKPARKRTGQPVVSSWTEYGVLLTDGQIAAAASEQVVRDYVWGRPVFRAVRLIAIPNCGQAVVDEGDWQMLGRKVRAS